MSQPKFKVGDEVFVVYPGFRGDNSYQYLKKIKSITGKRGDIKLDDFALVFNSEGRGKGSRERTSSWGLPPHLEIATPELKAAIRADRLRKKMIHDLTDFNWKELDQTALELIHAVIDKHNHDKKGKEEDV